MAQRRINLDLAAVYSQKAGGTPITTLTRA
jgi:hypothetical protein